MANISQNQNRRLTDGKNMKRSPTEKSLENLKRGITFKDDPGRINRNGKPRQAISALLKEYGDKKQISYDLLITNKDGKQVRKQGKISAGDKKTINQVIATILLEKALDGDMKAIEQILDRQEGKATQTIINDGSSSVANVIINRTVISNGPEFESDIQSGTGIDILQE